MKFQSLALACALAGLSRALAVEAEFGSDPSWQSWQGSNPSPSYGHGSSYYHQPSHQIPYKPFSGQKRTLTAHCEFDNGVTGEINLYQKPGMAMKIKGELASKQFVVDQIYKLRIQTYSYIECTKNGQEFNPLQSQGPSHPYHYSDPNIGRIPPQTITVDEILTIDKQYLLQNLQGPEAIVGKSINLYKVDTADYEITLSDVPLACCSIVCDNLYSYYDQYTPVNPYGLGQDYYKYLQGGHGSYGGGSSSHYPSYGGGSSSYGGGSSSYGGGSSGSNQYW